MLKCLQVRYHELCDILSRLRKNLYLHRRMYKLKNDRILATVESGYRIYEYSLHYSFKFSVYSKCFYNNSKKQLEHSKIKRGLTAMWSPEQVPETEKRH